MNITIGNNYYGGQPKLCNYTLNDIQYNQKCEASTFISKFKFNPFITSALSSITSYYSSYDSTTAATCVSAYAIVGNPLIYPSRTNFFGLFKTSSVGFFGQKGDLPYPHGYNKTFLGVGGNAI
jgi:hypothetical protein